MQNAARQAGNRSLAIGTRSSLCVDRGLPPTRLPARLLQETVGEQQPCGEQAKAFADCMNWSNGDMVSEDCPAGW